MEVAENMESESDSSNEQDDVEAYTGNEEITVDFDGRNPTDSDFDGIRQLLSQLFLKGHINLSEMTDLIIGQNYVGSVITQSEIDENDDDMEDDDDLNFILGITTAINITNKKDVECIKQLRTYLIEKAETNASEEITNKLKNYLGNDGCPIGFLINERFVNIPAQISVPLLENLCKEIRRANEKQMSYNFSYYLMLIKFHRKKAKKKKPSEDEYTNLEEELFCKESILTFEYSVKSECDSAMDGQWLDENDTLIPYRKCILFEGSKLPKIVSSIKSFVNE